jgi:hypothetical protein
MSCRDPWIPQGFGRIGLPALSNCVGGFNGADLRQPISSSQCARYNMGTGRLQDPRLFPSGPCADSRLRSNFSRLRFDGNLLSSLWYVCQTYVAFDSETGIFAKNSRLFALRREFPGQTGSSRTASATTQSPANPVSWRVRQDIHQCQRLSSKIDLSCLPLPER